MLDAHDEHGDRTVIDGVEHPKLATPRRVNAFQGSAQGLPHPVRVVRERSEDELDTGDSDGLRQLGVQSVPSRRPERDAIAHGSSGAMRPASLELGTDLIAGNVGLN
jgi:hypothetical protein